MKEVFKNKKITGMLAVLPENSYKFEDELNNYSFPPQQTLRMKKIMGYDSHRLVKENTAPSDLAIFGFKYLFEKNLLSVNEIDALVVVTQTPDYFTPPVSNILQGKLDLRKDILCLDINQACAGFVIGLMQAFMLLNLKSVKKVALVNIDTLSKKVCKADRNSFPLVGDAASITIVENAESEDIYFNLFMDGTRADALIIKAGGFKYPSTPETATPVDLGDGNFRALDNLSMDGTGVFNFVQGEVPEHINELFGFAEKNKQDIDYYLFHQPNKFMLEKLADKMEVPREKMPSNIVSNFGNSSGVTIPVNVTFNLGAKLLDNSFNCCLAGFGGGLTLASMIINLSRFKFCEQVISDC